MPRRQYHRLCPNPMTSAAKADGRFNNDAFIYDSAENEYTSPAGEALIRRFSSIEKTHEAAPVLEPQMPRLRLEIAVHTEQATTGSALGT